MYNHYCTKYLAIEGMHVMSDGRQLKTSAYAQPF